MKQLEWWEAELLDKKNQKKGEMPKITGGSLDWSIFRSVKGTGSLELSTTEGFSVNWLSDRIRLFFCKGDPEGEVVRMPFGIWLPSIPEWEHQFLKAGVTLTHASITLSDKTEIFNSPIGRWLTYPTGTIITDQVVAILRAFNETSFSITPSTSSMRSPKTWTPEDTWLTVINDLLDLISFSSLWMDREGVIRSEPYVIPELRPVVGVYGDVRGDMKQKKVWQDELPIFDVPTGFVVFVGGDDDSPGLIGRADLPDSHPLSAASLGREKLQTETTDAADQEAANLKARSRLSDSMQITRRTTIEHPIEIDNFPEVNDAVQLRLSGYTGVIVQRKIDLKIGSNVSSTIRRIYTGGDLPWD